MERKEAIEVIKKNWPDSSFTMLREALETLIPEFKESEDERIRKKLLSAFKGIMDGADKDELWYGLTYNDILAWLEKQGEQKPYRQRKECKDCQFNYAGECKGSCAMKRDEQKPAELSQSEVTKTSDQVWSEEDETRLTNIIIMLKEGASHHFIKDDITKAVEWLKSLKPQNHWKPTEPQLVSLTIACDRNDRVGFELTQLLKELKKL